MRLKQKTKLFPAVFEAFPLFQNKVSLKTYCWVFIQRKLNKNSIFPLFKNLKRFSERLKLLKFFNLNT